MPKKSSVYLLLTICFFLCSCFEQHIGTKKLLECLTIVTAVLLLKSIGGINTLEEKK
jgi:hypothetical protein